MTTEAIISTPQVSLFYHRDTGIVHHEFRQFVFGEQFRSILMGGLDLMRQHGCCKWLSDDRGNMSLAREDILWSDRVWLPAVLDAGWKYWAVVVPDSIIGQMNIEKWADKFRAHGVTAMAFSDPDAAMRWLEEQE
jgi:hypothetical protein